MANTARRGRTRSAGWEAGEEIKLTEANLVLMTQIARGWSDAELASRAEVPAEAVEALNAALYGTPD